MPSDNLQPHGAVAQGGPNFAIVWRLTVFGTGVVGRTSDMEGAVMVLVFLLAGIGSGLVSAAVTFLAGQGALVAALAYVMGGSAGALGAVALAAGRANMARARRPVGPRQPAMP